ncbi:MAG: acyl-CoA dehydrogenase family protein [Acidimicrobiaceae bacterium]|nr:acyl-CoA dehydrogenase family protein [Acidimicrobiaceae bacterium]
MTETRTGAPMTRPYEPGSPAELIRRAEGMRDMLRDQQDDAEARGHYGPAVHDAFVRAGFYHLLTPKRYGGMELDIPSYIKLVIEIARGDPSTAWCYSLPQGHCLTTASHWPAEAQDEVFASAEGYFRASHSVANPGTATPVEGGYIVKVHSPYQSGVPYSNWVTVNARLVGTDSDQAPILSAIVPIEQVDVLDDWGGDTTLGQRGSGSNTVVVTDVFVPASRVVPFDWMFHDYEGSVGVELHGNPMYLGPVAFFFHSELAATMVGAAKASVDEYEQIITTRNSLFPPFTPRVEDPMHLSDFGMAVTMADASEALLIKASELYMEYCEATAERGVPFTQQMDVRLYGVAQRAAEMACDAVQMLFYSAGSAAGKRGQPMQRYFRDVAMYRGHISAQYRWAARRIAEVHFAARDKGES